MAEPWDALRWEGLTCRLGERTLFEGWSAQMAPGLHWVCGDEGVGKTTLLRLFAGELSPQAGQIQRPGNGSVFWVDPRTTAHDQVVVRDLLAQMLRSFATANPRAVHAWTEALDLTPHLDKPLYMLSTGSRRKVWLVAAVASGAAVTLLDQPCAALDKASERVFWGLLAEVLPAQPQRVWVLADYGVPAGAPVGRVWALPVEGQARPGIT